MGRLGPRLEKLRKYRLAQKALRDERLEEQKNTSTPILRDEMRTSRTDDEIHTTPENDQLKVAIVNRKPKIRKQLAKTAGTVHGHVKGKYDRKAKDHKDSEPLDDWQKLASKHFPTLVTDPEKFTKKQVFTAEEIVTKIFSVDKFDCTCDHYLIGASSFYDMLNMKVNFDKQHKKFAHFDCHRLSASVEESYASQVDSVEAGSRRSNRYPFLCATPDVIHVSRGKVYYDEIKSSTSKSLSSFWNQRYLFQLYIASLVHEADHYRIIGIHTDGARDGEPPDDMRIVCCIEVVFKFDILSTKYFQEKMYNGYRAFLKLYFFTTGVRQYPSFSGHLQKEFNRALRKPHTSTPMPIKKMESACNTYLKCFDLAGKFDKMVNIDTTLSLADRKKLYARVKAQQRFTNSLSLHFYRDQGQEESIKQHPFRKVDLEREYRREPDEICIQEAEVHKVKVTITEENWAMFFDDFLSWKGLLDAFPPLIFISDNVYDLD